MAGRRRPCSQKHPSGQCYRSEVRSPRISGKVSQQAWDSSYSTTNEAGLELPEFPFEISYHLVWFQSSPCIRFEKQVRSSRHEYGEKPMKKLNIKGCRQMLEAKRGELLSGHYKTEGLSIERVPDSIEELTLEVERNMAVDALNRKSALLEQVTEALERIAGGDYGMCLTCQKEISPKRLAALPWAVRCLECQQAAENALRSGAMQAMSLQVGLTT